jgi:two-component system response regulator YesN
MRARAILNVKQPDVKGIDVARKIREQHEDIHFIIMTGYPEIVESIETIDVGIEEILLKPIDPDELLRAVQESLVGREELHNSKATIPP